MLGQKYLPEAPFAQFRPDLILSETVMRIKLLAPWSIEWGLVFDKLNVIFEVLCSLRIKQTQFPKFESLGNILEDVGMIPDSKVKGMFQIGRILVYVDLR